MVLSLTITLIVLFLLILKFILPTFIRYSQLRKQYRNISLIPISPIPLVGNAHCAGKRPNVFFELLCQTAKECQDQDKGAFCFWYLLWPTVFLSSSKGLEVNIFCFFFLSFIS